jgi:uncharacterized protein YqeY
MSLFQRIEKDFVAALKAKRAEEVAVLRMLKAAIKNKEVEVRHALTDAEILDVIAKQVKQRQESVELYRSAGREDLAQVEEREIFILQAYLPQPLTETELQTVVEQSIATIGASGMQDMGRVMQAILTAYPGRVDGKAVSALVRARLSS